MKIKRRVLVFGDSPMLRALAGALHSSPRLYVLEHDSRSDLQAFGGFHPDVILLDAEQSTAEQFTEILSSELLSQAILISIDPQTYQIIVLSPLHYTRPIARIARVIEILSVYLPKPISLDGSHLSKGDCHEA